MTSLLRVIASLPLYHYIIKVPRHFRLLLVVIVAFDWKLYSFWLLTFLKESATLLLSSDFGALFFCTVSFAFIPFRSKATGIELNWISRPARFPEEFWTQLILMVNWQSLDELAFFRGNILGCLISLGELWALVFLGDSYPWIYDRLMKTELHAFLQCAHILLAWVLYLELK